MLANKQYNLKIVNPLLAKQWHPTQNGLLTPQEVAPNSNKIVWWICKNGHKWQSAIANRNLGVGCPYCSGHKVNKENCLQTFNPKLAEEWHPSKNGKLTPKDVHKGSHKKVWWKCKQGHEWQAIICNRNKYMGCPFCPKEVNLQDSLQLSNPKVSKEWHPTKNGKLTPQDVHKGSNKKAWWVCKNGHEWETQIYRRNNGRGCPYCLNQKVNVDNCLETNNKILSMQWHPTRNGTLTPKDVTFGSHKSIWWLCKQGHEWKAVVKDRNKGRGCPMCKPKTSQLELRIYSELSLFFNDIIQRKKIFGFECDVYIPSIKIAIEFDGYYWHKNKHKKDKNKNIQLNKNGVILFRVREYRLRKIFESDIILSKSVNEFEIIKGLLNLILIRVY
ncbi:MAG TPA: zinc-ribbon domain-containing protein [Ignavibacteria bacterium]